MYAHHATRTGLATAHTGSTVQDNAPSGPASSAFDLILAAAGSALGSPAAPCTRTISATGLTTASQAWPPQILHPAFDAASRWKHSGTGPNYGGSNAPPKR